MLKISGISTDKRVFFLNRNLEPVKVERIEKVPCTGEIYDATVSNHIILIKRNAPVWSGNSNTENHDLKFIEIKCGDNILNYEWINNPILIRNYECSETGTGKVLTSGKHYIEFKFSLQTYNPNIYYNVKNND